MVEKKPTAKPSKDIVYLDVDDDITSIVDKVEAAKNKIVALVLPKRFATLQSIVNMRLLKRSAERAGKNVVLITNEHALLPLAGAATIHVAKNLQSQPEIPLSPVDLPAEKPTVPEDPDAEIDEKNAKLDYHRSVGELASIDPSDETETIPLEDEDSNNSDKKPKATKTAKNKKLKIPNFERFRFLVSAGILGVVLLIVLLILALFVWPKATVTLQTESSPLSSNFDLTTSDTAKTLDESKNIIPASLKTSDLTSSQQAQATGQQNNGQKAAGSVTISNCSSSPVDIPAGTGITQSGLAYITQSSLSLDSGNFTSGGNCKSSGSHVGSTNVVAQQAGSKYNGNISASLSAFPGVTASGSVSGGTDNIVTVLSQSDVDGAKNKVSDQDKNNFSDNFKKQLDDQGLYVIPSSFKANDPVVSSAPAVGQPASTASVSIKITYSALVIQKSDLKKVITDQLNKQIDQSKQKIGTNDVLQNLTVSAQSQKSPTVATLSVSEETTAIPILNIASIKKQVSGHKTGEIKSLLSNYPGVKNVSVKLSPFWVSKAPKKPSKITIVQQQIKSQP